MWAVAPAQSSLLLFTNPSVLPSPWVTGLADGVPQGRYGAASLGRDEMSMCRGGRMFEYGHVIILISTYCNIVSGEANSVCGMHNAKSPYDVFVPTAVSLVPCQADSGSVQGLTTSRMLAILTFLSHLTDPRCTE
ncbi:hypothetical protein BJ878DRAFT_150199 [Calycina marina]|uniref:Secreted protein n=1 Tax=Calycina marina TaxID=1763456 RepID=A0A9P8CDJ1_9HELO|nr:hypothetical protein BJ878DRAFT_150199 [Calycina marina]